MEASDYYSPETLTATVGYRLGRGAQAIRIVAASPISPFKASAAVGVAWGGLAGVVNARKYKRGQTTKRDAVLDTAGESVGMGLSAGLGLLASNAVRASLITAAASSVVPFTIGLIVTAGAKVIWNCTVKRHLKCEDNMRSQGTKTVAPIPSSS
jgi:hypothetical protein